MKWKQVYAGIFKWGSHSNSPVMVGDGDRVVVNKHTANRVGFIIRQGDRKRTGTNFGKTFIKLIFGDDEADEGTLIKIVKVVNSLGFGKRGVKHDPFMIDKIDAAISV